MPYQNNNNRLTPKATGKTSITPEAQILNKEIKYKFDNTKAEETLKLTQGLADLGKGIAGIFETEEKKHAEEAIQMIYNDDVEGKNKHDWAEAVERDKTGTLAKFNPYLKENYKKLAAQDFYQQELYELYKDPNYAAMSEKDIHQKIEQSKEHFRKTLLDNNIETKFAAKYLEDYHTQANEYFKSYLLKSNERQFDLSLNSISNAGSTALKTKLYNTSLEQQGLEIASTLTSMYELHKDEIPIEYFAKKVVLPTLINTIKTYNGTIDREALISTIKNTKFGNYTTADIIPDVEDQLRTSLRSIDDQKYYDAEREYQKLEREKKKKIEQADKEYTKLYMQDPANFDAEAQAKKIVEKYGIEDEFSSFVAKIVQTNKTLKSLNEEEVIENEAVKKAFTTKYINGDLTKEDLTDALEQGAINTSTALAFYSKLQTEETKKQQLEEKSNLASFKQKGSELTQYTKTYKDALGKIKTGDNQTLYTNLLDAQADIKSQVANEELSPTEGYKALDLLHKQAKAQLTKKKKQKVRPDSPLALVSAKYVSSLTDLPTGSKYNDTTAVKVFRDMGMMLYNRNPVLSSGVTPKRQLPGAKEAKAHNGYDFALKTGTPIYAPNADGINPTQFFKDGDMEVIFAGNAGTLGNAVLIKFTKTGDYMRIGHLDSINVRAGQKLRAGAVIGLSGNTGRSTGPHAHFDFFDSNYERAYAEDVMTRLTGKRYKSKNKI